MTDSNTQLLIKRARDGDPGSREILVDRYSQRLEASIQSRLGSLARHIDVLDVVQESFLRAFRSLERFEFRDEDSFFRWLGGISSNILREVSKRGKREIIMTPGAEIPSEQVSPSRAGRREERFERLEQSLGSLSDDHRQVILLARIEQLPMKDVAARMDRSTEATTQLLWRALKKLKESFGSTDSFHLPDRRLKDQNDDAH